MKLLRCNIVNYGCLHDFSYEFNKGINLINRPNGWGKSTLVSFLCAMLYGLDSTNRRNIQDNERKHYQPWQGGVFGGSLEFEISGRQYRIERFFGRREKEDTFILYDLKTMLPSQDYGLQPGFELFGIDKAGYLKSTCILQGKPSPEYNDSLAARLTGLTQTTDDINQYEQAVSAIDKALRFYVKTGNRGEISLLQQEADFSSQQLEEALQAGHEIESMSEQLVILEQRKEQLQQNICSVRQQIELGTHFEIESHYNLLTRQLEQKELELEQMEDFFHDKLPEDSDLEFYLQSCSRLTQTQMQIQHESLNNFQTEDFLFLQNLFSIYSASGTDTVTFELPVFSDSEEIFSPAQQKLLINSTEYKTEASLLFSSEEDFTDTEICCFHESLPDPDSIRRARELYFQYHDLMSAQKDRNNTVSSLTSQLKQLKDSISEEHQKISDCHEKISLLRKQYSSEEHHQSKHGNSPVEASPTVGSYLFCRSLAVISVIFIIAGFLTGYFITPAIGFISCLTGFLLLAYNAFHHKNHTKSAGNSNTVPVAVNNLSTVSEDDSFQTLCIQLETEIQLRTATCTKLENQLIQIQKQLDFETEASSTASASADACVHQLADISKQLDLQLDDDSLLTDKFLTYLVHLTSQLKTYEQIQQRQYDRYRKQSDFYKQLKQKYENYALRFQRQKQLEHTVSDLRDAISKYLQTYFPISDSEMPASLESKLHNLRAQLMSYKKLLSERHCAAQTLNLFLQEHPDFQNGSLEQVLNQVQPARPLAVLQDEESALHGQYSDCIQQISCLQSQIRQKQDIAEKYRSLEEKIFRLKQQISDYQERYRILSLTKQYLTKARQDFTDSYLKSIEKNFNHYASILQKDILLNTNMDTNFHVLVSDGGVLRETGWYSQGTRDLIDLCSRLAIVEDLFPKEQPFLILDDPFVNLDDYSLQQISGILHSLADRWQILYFTCHSSRNI